MKFFTFSTMVCVALIFGLVSFPAPVLTGWSEIDSKLYDVNEDSTGIAIDAVYEDVTAAPKTTPRHRRHIPHYFPSFF